MTQERKITNVSFSARFRELMESSGQTQKELAKALGLSEGAIINYKRDRTPKAEELVAIASYFQVTVDWLLCGGEDHAKTSDNLWRHRALAAEQKLEAVKAALTGLLKKF